MTKNVQIHVTMQQELDGEIDITESIVMGQQYNVHDKIFLKYQEQLEETVGSLDTTVKISSQKMTVTRDGAYKMKLEFVPGEKTRCNYPTPAGVMVLDIKTTDYVIEESLGKLQLQVVYQMELNENFVSNNSLKIVAG